MIYVKNTIIHADGDGVFTTNPQRRMFKQGQSIVLRHKDADQGQLHNICQYALNLSGSLYSVSEAILSRTLSNTDKKTSSLLQYCSRLVAQSYESQKLNIVNNSDFCTPADILKSEAFTEVSGAIREAYPEEIKIHETPDTNKIHQTHTFTWLRDVRKLVKRKRHKHVVFSISSALDYVAAFPESDHEVYKKIKSSGYLKDYNLDKTANPHRYNSKVFLHVLESATDPEDVIQQEKNINNNVFDNAESQLKQFYPHAKNFITYNKLAKMHLERMEQVEARFAVMIEAYAASNMTKSKTLLEEDLANVKNRIMPYKN